MQDTKMNTGEYILFSIPVEMLEEAGIGEESVIQMRVINGKIIIDTVKNAKDFVCDGDCNNCPMIEIDCYEDFENCPCYSDCEESGVMI